MSETGESGATGDKASERFWRTARRAAGSIPFMEDVVAACYAARDKNTPLQAKAVMLGALAYFVLPADAIPDVLLAFGFTDDVAVLGAAIAAIAKHITPEHRAAARQALQEHL
ncbi:MAG TPA: YkvA family protein [Mesorhizobium sp.]|jgi:uncharacterized membrane protein YkvA (DUF1232 family)|nr:YkvA family protein [Mesorhizobium sp.]